MADAESRVEIGFEGGLILSLKLAATEWAVLEAALTGGETNVAVTAEDQTAHVRLDKVCYVKHESHVGRIGF